MEMNRDAFYEHTENNINKIIEDRLFNNYKNQLFAWRLGVEFNRTYKEDYLWNKVLLLSSNSSRLLRYNSKNIVALKGLKESAEIYEYFYNISDEYDKEYCAILSALCYDISGYQANAYCLIREVEDYYYVNDNEEIDINITTDNYILYHIKKILLKKLPAAYNLKYKGNIDTRDLGYKLFHNAITNFYKNVLYGEINDINLLFDEAYKYYLNDANVYISHLLDLLTNKA